MTNNIITNSGRGDEDKGYIKCSKADLHMHSLYSKKCGLYSIKAILDYVEEMTDLDIIAITDHDETEGAQEAAELASRYSFKVIVGEEILTKQGEIIGLFLKERILPRKSLVVTLYEIHRQGGLAIVPHPFYFYGKFPGFKKAVSVRTLNKICKKEDKYIKIDALEAFNPSLAGHFSNRKVRKFNPKIFDLPITASSDAHSLEQIGRAYTLFPGKTKKDLYHSILQGITIIQGNEYWPVRETAKLIKGNVKKRLRKYGNKVKNKIS
jgi:predicted metal-dependent phosphoesterase TrpH